MHGHEGVLLISGLLPRRASEEPTGAISSGNGKRACDLPRGGRAPGFQAGGVRGPRRASGARPGPGRHAEADGKLRGQAGHRAAAAVPAHSAEHHPRLLPAAEGPVAVDDLAVFAAGKAGRRGARSAGYPAGRESPGAYPEPSSELERPQVEAIDRTGAASSCRHVNGRLFSCVTGRNWMCRRLRRRWAARKAV